MAFQRFPTFQFAFQQAAEEEVEGVVLLPGEARNLSKLDRALYALAIIANDSAPRYNGERLPAFKPPRVRLTGLEYEFRL